MCYNKHIEEKLSMKERRWLKMGYFWLSLTILFGIIEAVTVQIVSIWFAGGAVCALIAYALGASEAVQIGVFVIFSAFFLALTRPFVKKLTNGKKISTNADSLIGKTAVVTKQTDELGLSGEAKVAGSVWTISSIDGKPIYENEKVTVEKIEGES